MARISRLMLAVLLALSVTALAANNAADKASPRAAKKKADDSRLVSTIAMPQVPYVKPDGGKAWYLQEGFELAAFPPASWSLAGAANLWSRSTLCSGYGTGTASARADFYNISSGTQDLITLTFTASTATDSLKFDHAYATYSGENDQLQISTSTNGGTSWNTLITLDGGAAGPLNTGGTTTSTFVPTAGQWASKGYPLPVGTNAVKFTAITAYGNQLYIDNVAVGCTFVPVAQDVKPVSIDTPATVIVPPSVPFHGAWTIKNNGTTTVSDFTTHYNLYDSLGALLYAPSYGVVSPDSLAPDSTRQIVAPTDFTPDSMMRYHVEVITDLAGDGHPENDTMRFSFRTYDRNVGATAIVVPAGTYVNRDSTITPTATYHNFATEAATFDVYFEIDFGGGPVYLENTTITGLAPGADTTVTFAAWSAPHDYGTYALKAYTVLDFDLNPSNDSLITARYVDPWTPVMVAPLPAAHECHATVYDPVNDKIYVIGGTADGGATFDATVHQYDPAADTWTNVASIPTARDWLAAAYCRGKIYAAGGYTGAYSSLFDIYDITGNSWSSGPALSAAMNATALVAWHDSLVYRVGGNTGSAVATVQYYDAVAGGAWVDATALPGGWQRGGYSIIGDTIYLVGGINTAATYLGNIIRGIIDPSAPGTIAWDQTIALPFANGINGCDVMNGELFMVGGFQAGTTAVGTMYQYDWSSDTWSPMPSLPTPNVRWDNAVVRDRPGKAAGDYLYVMGGDSTGSWAASSTVYRYSSAMMGVAGKPHTIAAPGVFSLSGNYPNPFHGSTQISFQLPKAGRVSLAVYSITGQLVRTLVSESRPAGHHTATWNGKDNSGNAVSSGIYFYRLNAGANSATGKLVMIR